MWCQELDSNQPHPVLQTGALPDELPWHKIWCSVGVTIPSGQLERLVISPEIERNIFVKIGARGWERSNDLSLIKRVLFHWATRANNKFELPTIRTGWTHWIVSAGEIIASVQILTPLLRTRQRLRSCRLAQNFGSAGRSWTDGFTDLQSVAMGLSATAL